METEQEPRGKLIHCNGIVRYLEPDEFGYKEENHIDKAVFNRIFLKDYKLNYILDYCLSQGIHFHIATHSQATKTCKEKQFITGLPLERIIKGFYLRDSNEGLDYALVIPGDRSYLKSNVAKILKIEESKLMKSDENDLPLGIKRGTVHPFLNEESFSPQGKVKYIFFDKNFAEKRKKEGGIDDFSITIHPSSGYDNERTSIQINYNDAKDMLMAKFGEERVKLIDLI